MKYDCSITKRRGCNYCLREKILKNESNFNAYFTIFDEEKYISYSDGVIAHGYFEIKYCPICGKEL